MEARQLVVASPFAKNSCEGVAANEGVEVDPIGFSGAYGLHPAICIKDCER